MKQKKTRSLNDEKNSIDRLPDAVLISIVTLLSFKEAARTSVLSKKWRCFWLFNRVLDFDGLKTVHRLRDRRDELSIERVSFVDWVNRVLGLHSPSETIQELRVSFELNMDNLKDINSWIEFAYSKGVKRLDLNMAETKPSRTQGRVQEGPYTFPSVHYLSLFQLTWESLVSLHLTQVCVDSHCLTLFTSNCPFLEELHMENVTGLRYFKTSPLAIQLRRLVIISSSSFFSLEICSPNLVSCVCTFALSLNFKLGLKDVSSLSCLSLGNMFLGVLSTSLCEMSESFSSLETLSIQLIGSPDKYLRYPILPGLRKLIFDVHEMYCENLLFFTPLLNAAPSLHEIVMKLKYMPFLEQRQGRRPHKGEEHRCLKVFDIQGYASVEACPEVIVYVIENASSFERLIINGNVMSGEVIDLLRSKLDSDTCVEDVTDIVFPDEETNRSNYMNAYSNWSAQFSR